MIDSTMIDNTMSFLFEQLPLAVQLRDDATFDNFYSAENDLVVDQLMHQLPTGDAYIYLYGANRCGRSHLLQAACHRADQLALTSVYLPLNDLRDYPPANLFEGLEQLSLVCLDDIQLLAGDAEWEQQLFHLYNRLQQRGGKLLVSANCAVRELPLTLADLASRLSWGAVYQLKNLNDEQLTQAFKLRANKRGLELSDEVAQYIYHRCHRDTRALINVLEQLDSASLKQQRRLTVPFVKATLGW
jgi:DnaA-homolog protein